MAEYIEREAVLKKQIGVVAYDEGGWDANIRAVPVEDIEAIHAADVVPKVNDAEGDREGGLGHVVRCRYCSPENGSAFQWVFEDIEVTVTLQGGVLTICNCFGEEEEMPIDYCPNCGAKMDGDRE